MKKTLIPLMVLVLLTGALVLPVAADAPQPPAQLEYVDGQLTVLAEHLAEFQTEYHAAHGQYFQALESHSTLPDGLEAPDGLTGSPSDQDANLASLWVFASLPDELDWSFRVDTYTGVDGEGYVLTVTALLANGETWTKSVQVGPDAWRAADWYQVVESEF